MRVFLISSDWALGVGRKIMLKTFSVALLTLVISVGFADARHRNTIPRGPASGCEMRLWYAALASAIAGS
jgi:hypothetical protein